MKSKFYRYILLAVTIIIILFNFFQNQKSKKDLNEVLFDFKDSQIEGVSVVMNSINHSIDLDKENSINIFKDTIFDFEWQLSKETSFNSNGNSTFLFTITGPTEISSIHVIGKEYVIIETFNYEKRSSRVYNLEVNWQEGSYEKIKELVRDSR